jgi:hypothetical protein
VDAKRLSDLAETVEAEIPKHMAQERRRNETMDEILIMSAVEQRPFIL